MSRFRKTTDRNVNIELESLKQDSPKSEPNTQPKSDPNTEPNIETNTEPKFWI